MKKIYSAFILAGILLGLAACGASPDATDNKSSADAEGYGSYTAENPLVFKIAYGDSEDNVAAQACVKFEEYVEEQSGGAVQVERYGNGQMGSDEDVLQAILLGNIQLTYTGTSTLCTYDDRFGILDLPYLFTDWDTMNEAVCGELGDLYESWLPEYGLYSLGFMWDGCKTVSNSVRPITSVADMKGLKLRVTNADLYIQTYQALGANPTPMSWNDIYTGLQQGTVDGMDVPAIPTYTNGFYEAIQYFSLTNNHMSNMIVATSQSYMDSLPGGIRAVIEEGAKQYLVEWDRAAAKTAEEDAIQAMIKDGILVNEIEEAELAKFVESTAPVYEYYRELIGDEIMDTVESFRD